MRLRTKSFLLSVAIGISFAPTATSQGFGTVGTAKFSKADFAVPDAPALKMLDVDASKILRPTSVKSLTASLASASGDISFIPKAFAVEFSPGLLVDGENLNASKYKKNKEWYRTRISFATLRGDGASARTNIAAAVRFTLQDNADPRVDSVYVVHLLSLTDFLADSMVIVAQQKAALRIPVGQAPTAEQQKKIEAAVASLKLDSKPLLQALKHAKEEEKWNDDVADIAIGVRGSSPDSTGKATRFDGVAGWLTKGWGFRPNFQLLFGARGAYERQLSDTATKNDLHGSGDGIIRLYMGSNQYKVLVEGQGTGGQAIPKWLLNAGGELQLSELIWINASAGWNWEGSKGNFVSSFKVKFNPPGA